jgi:signal transduction histidine kinase
LDQVYATGEPFVGGELSVRLDRRGDGVLEEAVVNFVYQPIKTPLGGVEGIFAHAVEVTEQVRARQQAETAVRLRDEFLSIASHELRTPLTTLSAHAQVLLRRIERGSLDLAQTSRSAKAVTEQAAKLARLIAQLLDVTRLEAGKLQLERQHLDLVDLVARCTNSLRTAHEHRSIRLQAPPTLQACLDPLRFEQVLTNLLDNAIKYSSADAPIDLALSQPSPELIELAVQDQGVGIPPERRDHIFERFYQAHGDAHRSGMGLGLYISRQIVELHGGQIWAEFPADGGTRLMIHLPTGLP